MSKVKILTLAVAGLLIVNAGLLAFLILNRPGGPLSGGGPGRPGEGPRRVIIEKLDFDREQVSTYEALIGQHQARVRELNDEMGHTRNALYATLAGNAPFDKDSLISRLGNLQSQIEGVHYAHFEEIEKLCRPDQKDNFRELTKALAGYFGMPRNPPPTGKQNHVLH